MSRLATIDASKLLDINPRLVAYLTDVTTPIGIKLLDVTVLPDALEARLKLQLSDNNRDTVIGSYQTRNGTGTNANTNYVPKTGNFIFQPGDKTEQEIVISLKGNNAVGKTIEVYLKAITGAVVTKSSGWINFSTDPQQVVDSGFQLIFQTDFITGFQFSDTGLLADGVTPCWQSRPAHGRTQDGNKELGLYVDPVLYPTTNPFPIVDNKRHLRSEKLDTPLHYSNRDWYYTASMINSRKLISVDKGRIECRLAMPLVGDIGAWPAFWLMPMSGNWPPEIDMMEWPLNINYNQWTYYSTQHWVNTANVPKALGYPVDLRLLGIPTDLTDFHVYGITITEEALIFDIDGIKTIEMENRSPADTWYVLLNIAMGGSWPGSPTTATTFPCDMILDWLKVYKAV